MRCYDSICAGACRHWTQVRRICDPEGLPYSTIQATNKCMSLLCLAEKTVAFVSLKYKVTSSEILALNPS